MKTVKSILSCACLFVAFSAAAQTYPYQNPALSFHERAVDLCSRLTIEEKALLMQDESPAIPRLGIKQFNWWSEALHGLANQGNVTVFPEPIGMAASFDENLVEKVFTVVSDETRAKYNEQLRDGIENTRFHSLSVWTPNVNIFRDPRWGRGQETYGEDPYLTSLMGAAVVRGLQGPQDTKYRKLYACAKHYAVHSGPEWSRHTANLTDISPRDLWETYLPAFKYLVEKSDVREVMCAYQRLDDEPCCGNTRLLQQILRDEWGFKYMVVSDCGAVTDFYMNHKSSSDAVHASSKAVLAGTDVECGFNYAYKSIAEAVKRGLISEKEIDKHVIRLLEGRFELGEMDDPKLVSWSNIPASILDCKAHQNLSLDMARKSIVLLQNKNNILPLKGNAKNIAIIGPNADNEPLMWGNYNGVPNKTITILDGVRMYNKRIPYYKGCDLTEDVVITSLLPQCSINGKKGVLGKFWNNRKMQGNTVAKEYYVNPINVTTAGQHTFANGVKMASFSALYETNYTSTFTGEVVIRLEFCSQYKLFINDKLVGCDSTWRTTPVRIPLNVEKGKTYNIRLEYADVETWGANLKFNIGLEKNINYDETINKLKDIETVVFVGGISAQLEGEEMPVSIPGFKGGDRTDIELPLVQRNFIKALKAAGKKIIFVNCSGSAIALEPEAKCCDAIVQAWYPGEKGGQAVADVLFGKVSPSGKLPVTFYSSSEQLPDFEDYSMRGRTYRYMTEKPLFPFGYGLSYTKFEVGSAIEADANHIVVPVKNVGSREGSEVVQIYIRKVSDANGPIKTLRAYKRVSLKAGSSQNVNIPFNKETFECFDEQTNTMRVAPGKYEIMYGTSSADEDLQKLEITI